MEQDFYAEYYEIEGRHWWFAGRRAVLTTLLERELPRAGDGERRILDVGCGTGAMLATLRRFGRAEGVDAEPLAVAFCHRRGETDVAAFDGSTLPRPDASLDVVCAFDVLEHIADDGAMLREMRRVLRPGGLLALTVPGHPVLWGAQDEISHHERRYRRGELERVVREAGFQLRRLTPFNTLLFPPIAAIRLLRRVIPARGELKSDFTLTSPGRIDRLLARFFAAEAALLRRRDLPFGVSFALLARRPEDAR